MENPDHEWSPIAEGGLKTLTHETHHGKIWLPHMPKTKAELGYTESPLLLPLGQTLSSKHS